MMHLKWGIVVLSGACQVAGGAVTLLLPSCSGGIGSLMRIPRLGVGIWTVELGHRKTFRLDYNYFRCYILKVAPKTLNVDTAQ
jgi:hypothetical protein